MYGIDDPTNTPSVQTPSAALTTGWFQPGNYITNIPATTITCDWLNGVNWELVNTVVLSGQTPSKTLFVQMVQAIGMIAHAPVYAFSGLPGSATTGSAAWVSNGRRPGQGAGAGTGVVANWSGTAWISVFGGTVTA